jgi:RNAse (barnase) inhibitor barstar
MNDNGSITSVEIDLTHVHDWDSFHAEFAQALGFPEFYGANMNAWEDAMSDLSKPGLVGMTKVEVPLGDDLVLVLRGAQELRAAHPDIFGALIDSTAHVNRLKVTIDNATRLLLLPV